jgi:hypothetical protein
LRRTPHMVITSQPRSPAVRISLKCERIQRGRESDLRPELGFGSFRRLGTNTT